MNYLAQIRIPFAYFCYPLVIEMPVVNVTYIKAIFYILKNIVLNLPNFFI